MRTCPRNSALCRVFLRPRRPHIRDAPTLLEGAACANPSTPTPSSPRLRGASGRAGISRCASRWDGTWYYQGTPIGRLPLVKLFASVLRRAEDGRYWLVTPAEQGLIEVEDVPFVAVELACEGSGPSQQLSLRTNLDEWVAIDDQHPLEMRATPDKNPQRHICGSEIRLMRECHARPFYHLVELAEPSPGWC